MINRVHCEHCGQELGRRGEAIAGRFCERCVDRIAWEDLVYPTSEAGVDWDTWGKRAEIAAKRDYGCQFDSRGQCAQSRSTTNRGLGCWSKKSCCAECADNKGYLQAIPIESLAQIKALFDKEDGFWSPAGCRLPAKWRSFTCFAYCCESAVRTEAAWKMHDKYVASLGSSELPIVSVK